MGYRLRGNYVLKDKLSNLEKYLRDTINKYDYYEIKPEMRKIGSTFSGYLYNFIYNLDLFKVDDEKYMTIRKLKKLGINKDMIRSISQNIDDNLIEDEYFSYYSLKNKEEYFKDFTNYSFPNCFFETIISAIPTVKVIRIDGNMIFIKTEKRVTREEFIDSLIDDKHTSVQNIRELMKEKFNIDLQGYYIKEFIDKKKYFVDEDGKIQRRD